MVNCWLPYLQQINPCDVFVMVSEVLFEIPHVQLVRLESRAYCLIVEDMMLNDYVEDFLWDHYEYESTSVTIPGRGMPPVYHNCFNENFPVQGLLDLLKQLDVNEVERVYRLNN